MQPNSSARGFTLIEMMATIAIIGVLTGIVLINYGDIRKRAHLKDAETAMNTARAAAALCVFRNSNLRQPNPNELTCDNSTDNWPNINLLAPGWSYTAASDVNVSDRTFLFGATDGDNTITCDQDGCETLP